MPPKGSETRSDPNTRAPEPFRVTPIVRAQQPAKESWWVGVPREQWPMVLDRENQRMTFSTTNYDNPDK